MIGTTIEQGERLLKAGIPKESADLWWCWYIVGNDTTPIILRPETPILYTFNWYNDPENRPSWSLDTLIRLAKERGIDINLNDISDPFEYIICALEEE